MSIDRVGLVVGGLRLASGVSFLVHPARANRLWGDPEKPTGSTWLLLHSMGYRDALIGGLLAAASLRGRDTRGWFLASGGASVRRRYDAQGYPSGTEPIEFSADDRDAGKANERAQQVNTVGACEFTGDLAGHIRFIACWSGGRRPTAVLLVAGALLGLNAEGR